MSLEIRLHERIILPLDGMNDLEEIKMVVNGLLGRVGPFKLGLETISDDLAHEVADHIVEAGGTVFLDGKFSDIPNTSRNATLKLLKRHPKGIWAVNVHGNSGRKSIAATVESRGVANVLGVTVLTSMDEEDTQAIYGCDPQTAVLRLAKLLVENGVQGLICAPGEVALLRQEFGDELLLVTPGIRPLGADQQDQARAGTPLGAITAGSDFLVVGRPITQAEDRQAAAAKIAEEIERGLAERLRR